MLLRFPVFLLDTVSIETYIETSSEHLPALFKVMVESVTAGLGSIGPAVLATCLATLRKVLARVQPAWNVWDVAEKLNKSRQEAGEAADVAREATESLPGSPFHVTLKEEAEVENDEKSRSMSDNSSVSSHETLVNVCKTLFLNMFCDFIHLRIIENPKEDWAKMVINEESLESEYQGLENLLNQVLDSSMVISSNRDKCQVGQQVILKSESEKFSDAFSLACHCILELSSMPKYNSGEDSQQPDSEERAEELPAWLLGLLLCCTVPPSAAASISSVQLAAVSAVVELATLVRHCSERPGLPTPSDGSVVVSMEPVMSRPQLDLVTAHTRVLVSIAETLWANLELSSVSVTAVSLLHRLISLARGGQVENVVAASLGGLARTEHSPAQYERFARLWHLSRDLTSSRSAVDLCTLKMVSGLRAGRGSVRAVCARWVEQCVARGDTGRLVEPLLLALLDAATARVSVSHAGVTRAGDVYSIRCGTTKFDIICSVKKYLAF